MNIKMLKSDAIQLSDWLMNFKWKITGDDWGFDKELIIRFNNDKKTIQAVKSTTFIDATEYDDSELWELFHDLLFPDKATEIKTLREQLRRATL